MSNTHEVQIRLKSTAEAQGVVDMTAKLSALDAQLTETKAALAAAAPESAEWHAGAQAVEAITKEMLEVLAPLREMATAEAGLAEATQKANAAVQAGVNPWTTASASYRAAQAALEGEARAAREAAAEHQKLTQAKQAQAREMRGDAVANAYRQLAQDAREAEAHTMRLHEASKKVNAEHARTPAVVDQASASSRNAGMSVLIFSQALEDAQYGIRGVLNNIPGLVLALGGSAGLAGVISVAAVAASQLVEHFGGLDKAAANLDWAKMTPDEKELERLEKFNEGLRMQRQYLDDLNAAWERRTEATKKTLEAEKALADHQQKLLELAGLGKAPTDMLDQYDARKKDRQGKVSTAADAATGDVVDAERFAEDAAQAEVRAQQQEKLVADLEKRQRAEAQMRETVAKLKSAQDASAFAEGASQGMMPAAEREALTKRIKEAEAEVALAQAQLKTLPQPNFTPSKEGTPAERQKKDEDAKAAAFDQAKEEAAQMRADADDARRKAEEKRLAAEKSAADAAALRADAARKQLEDDNATQREVAAAAGLPEPMPLAPGMESPILDPATRPLMTAPGPAPTGPAPETAEEVYNRADKQVLDEQTVAMAERLKSSMATAANEPIRAMLESLLTTLTDGRGNQAAELARIEQMYAQAEADKGQAMNILNQTVQAIADLNRNTVSMASGLLNVVQSTAASLQSLTSQVNQINVERTA